ncbi:hypothetical protein P4V47_19960 [Brevibacillus laterosporus]|uniref:hypothetical protein n=1 Tax=Brevibacillus laterosporus TaxID=1465 RepID=UPI002E1F1642|nr:hypothetical protein [Brevibacillus laterosporus]
MNNKNVIRVNCTTNIKKKQKGDKMNSKTLKFILTIFSVYGTMQVTKEMNIADNWFITEFVRFLIVFVVVFVVSILLDKIYKDKDKEE